MAFPQKEPLRALNEQEKRELHRVGKATSERLDVVRRAKAVLAVAEGRTFTEAAHEAGLKSGDGVGKLVKRFNQSGLAALQIAPGRGRKVTYTRAQRARILSEVQRVPDRKADQTATWSLKTLERALRQQGLSKLSASTIGEVLHEAGYAFGKTRTWCPTGTAKRKRKAGVVTVQDPQAQEKKD
jgi:transposase